MGTENAVSIIVGRGSSSRFHSRYRGSTRIIRVVHWSCVRLHNPQFSTDDFGLTGLDYYEKGEELHFRGDTCTPGPSG